MRCVVGCVIDCGGMLFFVGVRAGVCGESWSSSCERCTNVPKHQVRPHMLSVLSEWCWSGSVVALSARRTLSCSASSYAVRPECWYMWPLSVVHVVTVHCRHPSIRCELHGKLHRCCGVLHAHGNVCRPCQTMPSCTSRSTMSPCTLPGACECVLHLVSGRSRGGIQHR